MGLQVVESGIVVKRQITESGDTVCVNFWLPGEMVDSSPTATFVDYAALTKVTLGHATQPRGVCAELERAELLLYWRKLELKDRLVAILEYLAPRYGEPVEGGMQIVLTQTQLSELMGCIRETVNQALMTHRRAPDSRVKGGWGKLIWRDA